MRDLLKRYAKLSLGQPFSPGMLNILVTSVCDMRCTHCFFTEELDDAPRKKLQMTTREIERISETLGGNLGVLVLAGGEPFTRKDLPEIARAFYTNNRLESVYITSNGQIQKRILPDVARMLQECPDLNVTVALGIDGLKAQHDKIRRKPGSWDIVVDTARRLQEMKREYPRLDVQTCTCFMHSNQDAIFEWYDFLKYELKPDKVNFNYIRPPAADAQELDIDGARYARLAAIIDEDSRSGAIKNHYAGKTGFFKAALDIHMHGLIAKTQETQRAQLTCYAGTVGGVDLRRGHRLILREPRTRRQFARLRLEFPEALVFRRHAGAPRKSCRRVLLHARIELLLSLVALQPEASDSDQEAGKRNEEVVDGNRTARPPPCDRVAKTSTATPS